MNSGRCPNCKSNIQSVLLEDIGLKAGFGPAYHNGVTYLCPLCQCILGVSIDPVALKAAIVDEILAALKGGS